jgi:hypothetical protein
MITRNKISDKYFSKAFFLDGYDDAIIGVVSIPVRVCYSISKLLEISMNNGMDWEKAVNHVRYNIVEKYVDDNSPIFVDDIF